MLNSISLVKCEQLHSGDGRKAEYSGVLVWPQAPYDSWDWLGFLILRLHLHNAGVRGTHHHAWFNGYSLQTHSRLFIWYWWQHMSKTREINLSSLSLSLPLSLLPLFLLLFFYLSPSLPSFLSFDFWETIPQAGLENTLYVEQAGLNLSVTVLPQPPKYWADKHEAPLSLCPISTKEKSINKMKSLIQGCVARLGQKSLPKFSSLIIFPLSQASTPLRGLQERGKANLRQSLK